VNVPASRIKALAQCAVTTKAQNIANFAEQRRTATLVSFVRQLAVTAQDDSLDVLDMLIRDLPARSASSERKHGYGHCVIWTPLRYRLLR
jgi:hypothetical protein